MFVSHSIATRFQPAPHRNVPQLFSQYNESQFYHSIAVQSFIATSFHLLPHVNQLFPTSTLHIFDICLLTITIAVPFPLALFLPPFISSTSIFTTFPTLQKSCKFQFNGYFHLQWCSTIHQFTVYHRPCSILLQSSLLIECSN